MTSFSLFPTAHGAAAIAWSDRGVCALRLPAATEDEARHAIMRRLPRATMALPAGPIPGVVGRVQDYFAGSSADFDDIVLDLGRPEGLYARIYSLVRRLGRGVVTTYGAIAREIGDAPGLPRVVGQAMARNPVPLIIPCHRVLPAGGGLGGFSAPGGADAKARMLALEGVALHAGVPERTQASFAF